ncbi:metallophosphoesterase [Mucilaginibacter arboris]|uniref:Metallophosphoesterase n=1 Tax=Mucilaginibacter arboris TaxID=2682090 RepID=A0A7K1T2E9_9SPHI|nr:metallophosphoesterase [Mucilaginibacter arboris]MVN23480.1 metallophosphoesterase [Mucilaginibacter arboris]
MTLQYCSDLHLEFPENAAYLKANPLVPIGDILILAGDVILFKLIGRQKDFFDFVSDHFKETYWIPGNHEYYGSNIIERSGSFEEKIRDNVFLVNNVVKTFGIHQLVFSTLWSSLSELNSWRVRRGLNDFYQISHDKRLLQAQDYNNLHENCLTFLRGAIGAEANGKKVVVTHHVPTFENYPPEYKGDYLSEAFATALDDLILDTRPDYWIYGHHHRNIPEFKIGQTQMLTNQLGYVQNKENLFFDPSKCIEL